MHVFSFFYGDAYVYVFSSFSLLNPDQSIHDHYPFSFVSFSFFSASHILQYSRRLTFEAIWLTTSEEVALTALYKKTLFPNKFKNITY